MNNRRKIFQSISMMELGILAPGRELSKYLSLLDTNWQPIKNFLIVTPTLSPLNQTTYPKRPPILKKKKKISYRMYNPEPLS